MKQSYLKTVIHQLDRSIGKAQTLINQSQHMSNEEQGRLIMFITHRRNAKKALKELNDCELNPAKHMLKAKGQIVFMLENNITNINQDELIMLTEDIQHKLLMIDVRKSVLS